MLVPSTERPGQSPAGTGWGRDSLLATKHGGLLWLAVWLCFTGAAMGCPACYNARLLQSCWHLKMFAMLVGASVLVTFTRLHVIRVLYTFIPLALVTIKLELMETWYEHPAANTSGVPVALISDLRETASLLAPVLIACLGWSAFYRKDGQKGFLLWQPLAYLAVLFIVRTWLRI